MKPSRIISALLTIGITVVFFLTYRILIKEIGIGMVGYWSLILSWIGIGKIAEAGIGVAASREIAMERARGDEEAVSNLFSSSLGFVSASSLVFLPILTIVSLYYCKFPQVSDIEQLQYVGCTAIYILVVNLASPFRAYLDGCNCVIARQAALFVQQLSFLVFNYLLVIRLGKSGVFISQILSAMVGLCAMCFASHRYAGGIPKLKKPRLSEIRRLLRMGLPLQIISISVNLCEPVTKFMFGRFGGLDSVAVFDTASKLVQHARQIIVAPMERLVPHSAGIYAKNPASVADEYKISLGQSVNTSWPLLSLLVAILPFVSLFVFGEINNAFLVFSGLLCIAGLVNLYSVPAYFFFIGLGKRRCNVVSHVTITLLNAVASVSLGALLGGVGVLLAWVLSLIVGSVYLIRSFNSIEGTTVSVRDLVGVQAVLAFIAGGGGLLAAGILGNSFWYLLCQVLVLVTVFVMILKSGSIEDNMFYKGSFFPRQSNR